MSELNQFTLEQAKAYAKNKIGDKRAFIQSEIKESDLNIIFYQKHLAEFIKTENSLNHGGQKLENTKKILLCKFVIGQHKEKIKNLKDEMKSLNGLNDEFWRDATKWLKQYPPLDFESAKLNDDEFWKNVDRFIENKRK